LLGDINGDGKIDVVNDAVGLRLYLDGYVQRKDIYYGNADANGDGKVDSADVDEIMRIYNGEATHPPITVVDPPFTKGVAKYKAEVFADFTLTWKEKANEKIFANEQINVTGMSSDGKALRIEYYSTTEKINKIRWVSADAILSKKNDQGVWFFEANADGKNTIQEKFYSWNDLVKITSKGQKYNVAMSIYRAK